MSDESESGLSSEVQRQIRAVLSHFSEIDEAILYGSRAMGRHKIGSDIDLTLKGSGLDLTILNRVRTELDDLLLPYIFDLSILDQIENRDLIDHIHRVGRTFYQRSLNPPKGARSK